MRIIKGTVIMTVRWVVVMAKVPAVIYPYPFKVQYTKDQYVEVAKYPNPTPHPNPKGLDPHKTFAIHLTLALKLTDMLRWSSIPHKVSSCRVRSSLYRTDMGRRAAAVGVRIGRRAAAMVVRTGRTAAAMEITGIARSCQFHLGTHATKWQRICSQ